MKRLIPFLPWLAVCCRLPVSSVFPSLGFSYSWPLGLEYGQEAQPVFGRAKFLFRPTRTVFGIGKMILQTLQAVRGRDGIKR